MDVKDIRMKQNHFFLKYETGMEREQGQGTMVEFVTKNEPKNRVIILNNHPVLLEILAEAHGNRNYKLEL